MSAASILMLLALLLSAPPVEAQFLNKLSKGLEKVNKNLDKVNKAIDKATKENGKKIQGQESKSGNKASSQGGANESTVDDSSWETAKPRYEYPFISSSTKFMQVATSIYSNPVSDVCNGVFAVKEGNKFSFWTVDGRKLFDADWEYCSGYSGKDSWGNSYPVFVDGVVPVRRAKANAAGKKPVCLLYLDGRVKELDPAIEEVSIFADGLALCMKKVNYKKQYFYINMRGEKVFPALAVYGDYYFNPMRPLKEGLRAYSADNNKWGYIDASGKVAIPAKFGCARDFSEGYAWVELAVDGPGQGELALIDKSGAVVFKSGKSIGKNTLVNGGGFSDVVNGHFYVEKGSKTCYYNLSFKEEKVYEAGNSFYGGYAFVEPESDRFMNDNVFLVDKNFNEIKVISDKIVPAHILEEYGPHFSDYGLAVVSSINGNYVIDGMGNVVVSAFDDLKGNYIRGFRKVSPDGYFKATEIQLNQVRYHALIKADGEIAWLFANEPAYTFPVYPTPVPLPRPKPEPEPGDDIETPPIPGPPYTLININVNMPPIGPTTTATPKYKVSVGAYPGDGGTVSLTPGGVYEYGDFATVTASPNEGFAIVGVTVDEGGGTTSPKLGESFAVTSDMKLTVKFVKKDDDKDPPMTGTYQGTKHVNITKGVEQDIAYYARISSASSDSNPYGDNTHGYIVAMFDPTHRYVGTDVSTYIFSAPLLITGYQHDDKTGKDWLVLDGGAWVFGNLKFHSESMGGSLGSLMFNMMMAFDGHNSPNVIPRHYRVQMLDLDKETGEFTCGPLETFSMKKAGWVPAQDESLDEVTTGMFVTKTDHGYPADFFEGVRLKLSPERNDVSWYPPLKWYDNNESLLNSVVKSMGNAYRSTKSDYLNLFPSSR